MEYAELSTACLHLRRPKESDIDAITEICQDADIAAFTTVPYPYGRYDAAEFVQDVVPHGWSTGTGLIWAICARDQPERLLGVVSITDVHEEMGLLGYWLGAGSRGRGVMTEAVNEVIDVAFRRTPAGLGLRRLQWEALLSNVPSARVAQKTGFQWEGRRRSATVHRGQAHDLVVAGLLASDTRAMQDNWPR